MKALPPGNPSALAAQLTPSKADNTAVGFKIQSSFRLNGLLIYAQPDQRPVLSRDLQRSVEPCLSGWGWEWEPDRGGGGRPTSLFGIQFLPFLHVAFSLSDEFGSRVSKLLLSSQWQWL